MAEDAYERMDRFDEEFRAKYGGMGPMYFGLDGEPIKRSQWARLMQGKYDPDVKEKPWRVDETQVGPWWISTVWIGLDHNFGLGGPPIIYETMIFFHGDTEVDGEEVKVEDWGEEYMERYATREAAQAGHDRAVEHAKHMMKGDQDASAE
jgi:hypothetical protein